MRLVMKLFLGFFLIVGIAAFFVMRVFVNEVKPGVRQAMESTLVDAANVLAEMAAADVKAGTINSGTFARNLAKARQRDLKAMVWRFPKRALDYRVTITDAKGIVIYDSLGRDVGRDNSRWNDVYRTLRGEYGARSSPETPGEEGNTVMHVAAPVYDPGDGRTVIGVLTLAQPNRSIDPFIAASQRAIIERGAWLIGLSALVGVLVTMWLTTGLGQLSRYARAVTAGEPVPPPRRRRDEIGDLGQALETMRRKLEGKAYVEQYVQSLTHEMKSPLAAIRGAAELLQEPMADADRAHFARSILEQQERLTETIDKLLALAEVEQHGWLQTRAPIALPDLLQQTVAAAQVRAQAAGVEVRTDAVADLSIQGDAYLLRQALNNLVDNAVAFSPSGTEVVLQAQVEDGGVRLQVADRGAGIPDYARDRVFERFYSLARPGSGRRSSGLGLPFVQEVARLHDGRVQLQARDGGGTVASLWLPLGMPGPRTRR
ncbi:two-component system sensor histidine kinase CreC [Stenotrophomonas maltophilia]|uniref:two-component system sensor histidine kinase CreC n=1 Tax=Stenotrophomonas maltophilia TaxID=40324 RepID=UPI00209685C9|nr:two-component system sensor histidine kinase CreC [Stenotrophomonas maltophilia]MCO7398982.1 two-component system sensor histidine kinase CreC [Stenotrophomonas maltophilia]MCO7410532.1 two-component system sensor histidine kinase CreC [Stenotrophomonas maltophilia]HDS1649267.1 two-component system sensor histidine kinase CreC [Stenotrophomonas maltophilia]